MKRTLLAGKKVLFIHRSPVMSPYKGTDPQRTVREENGKSPEFLRKEDKVTENKCDLEKDPEVNKTKIAS